MSSNNTKTLTIILVLVIASSGSVYFLTTNQYKPIINELEVQNLNAAKNTERLETEIHDLSDQLDSHKNTIETLSEDADSLKATIHELEQEIIELEAKNEETSNSLNRYQYLAREFYKMHPIRIGFTAPTTDQVTYIKNIAEMAENKIHSYCQKNDLPYRFEFVVANNLGSDEVALSNMITYDILNINLVIGHVTDSQCQACIKFVNDNNMILLSPSSDSILLTQKDNLYRLSPNETMQLRVNLECMKIMEIKHVAIFSERNDQCITLSKKFIDMLSKEGIESRVIYYSERPEIDITGQKRMMSIHINDQIQIYGSNHVALQLIGSSKLPQLAGGSTFTPLEANVIWFGTSDSTYCQIPGKKNVALSAAILSPVPDIRSSKFSTFSNEVRLNYKFEVSYYGAAAYDACWLFALAVIDAGSLETDAIKQSLEKIALDYEGVSGLLI